jgi:hypothetical protein
MEAVITAEEDAELIDAVARYLSVQLVGAYTALNAQRREQLSTQAAVLRDELVAHPSPDEFPRMIMDAVHEGYIVANNL